MSRLAVFTILGALFFVGTHVKAFSPRRIINHSGFQFVLDQDSLERHDSDEDVRFNPKLHPQLLNFLKTAVPQNTNSRQVKFDLDSIEDDHDQFDFESMEIRRILKRSADPVAQDAKEVGPAAVKEAVPAAKDAKEAIPAAKDAKEAVPAAKDAKEAVPAAKDAKVGPAAKDAQETVPAAKDAKVGPAAKDAQEAVPAAKDAKVDPAAKDAQEAVPAAKDAKVGPAAAVKESPPVSEEDAAAASKDGQADESGPATKGSHQNSRTGQGNKGQKGQQRDQQRDEQRGQQKGQQRDEHRGQQKGQQKGQQRGGDSRHQEKGHGSSQKSAKGHSSGSNNKGRHNRSLKQAQDTRSTLSSSFTYQPTHFRPSYSHSPIPIL